MKHSNLFQNLNMTDMNKYWKELKEKNYSSTFTAVEKYVNNLDSENFAKQKTNKIQSMKNFFALNKFKLAYSFIFLAVIFAACNMPVTQNETIGHALSWKVSKSGTDAVEKINSLSWMDKSKLSVKETNEDGKDFLNYSLILDSKSNDEMSRYMEQLKEVNGITSIQLFPLNQTTKIPLYAAALHSFFRVNIDATNKSDAQVKEELQKQLKDAGVTDIKVDFGTDEKGNRMIKVEPAENGLKGLDKGNPNSDFELNLKDGNNEQFLITKHKSDGAMNFEGKSDDEIKRMVSENMKKDGIDAKPEDIKIERDAEGHTRVIFENTVEKNGNKNKNKMEFKIK